MQLSNDASVVVGVVAVVVALVVVVPVGVDVCVALVVAPVSVPVAVVELTVALELLLSPVPTISSAARKPTTTASAATSHVFEPRRSIAAGR
jgi:hypothetical protein